MAKKQQSRAQAKAASKSRPAGSSTPNAAAAASSSTSAPITAFSPFSPHFAILTQAIDRHRLSVYDTSASNDNPRLLVDYVLPVQKASTSQLSAQCTALTWLALPSDEQAGKDESEDDDDDEADDKKKRQKKTSSTSPRRKSKSTNNGPRTKPAIALGLRSGDIDIFDIARGKITRVLTTAGSSNSSTSSSSSEITSITTLSKALPNAKSQDNDLYATTKDGIVRVWNLDSVANAAESTVAAIRPHSLVNVTPSSNKLLSLSPASRLLLTASHTISSIDLSSSSQPALKSTYTAHATPLTHLVWLDDDQHFVSAAETDPVLYIWKSSRSKTPIGTIELEQGQEVIRVEAKQNVLAIVGSQGFLAVYDLSSLLQQEGSSKGTKVVKPTATHSAATASIIDIRLSGAESERLEVAAMIKSVKLQLSSTEIKDPATLSLLSTLSLSLSRGGDNLLSSNSDDATQTKGIADLQRYNDPVAASGRQSGAAQSSAVVGEDGLLVDGASASLKDDDEMTGLQDERSLEERLRGMRVVKKGNNKQKAARDDDDGEGSEEEDDDEDDDDMDGYSRPAAPTTSLSLSSSLSQALHSSDRALISSLLTTSNTSLIKSTVLRLNGPNAIKLLEACVERLNERKKGTSKSRRLIEWIKWTLRFHSGYLMSIPNLVTKLSNLHSNLSFRLNSHDKLLALQGRLELVLSQIELRSEYDVSSINGMQGVQPMKKSVQNAVGVEKGGKIWNEDVQDSEEVEGMELDRSDSDGDSDEEIDSDEEFSQQEEDGEIEDVGLDSQINIQRNGAVDDDSEEEEEEVPHRNVKKGKSSAVNADTSVVSGAATSDESDGDDEDGSEGDSEEDNDEEDESELEDDDEDEDEEDSEDEDSEGGFIDDEAMEGTEESEEEEEEE
ncbi:unnamed protein product [Sympodiomycopsis kandeliae]